MMHEIVTAKRTPEEARAFIAKEIVEYVLGRPAPYAENTNLNYLLGNSGTLI